MTEYWLAVVVGSIAVYSWKLLGYLFPRKIAENKAVARFATFLTIALLASLASAQTLTSGQALEFDSRLLAVSVAGIMFWRKLPFLLVITIAAAIAAGARYFLGWN